jgi:hypothetical protein
MDKSNIEKMVEETIQSIDGINRATPRPYLLTRLNARMQQSVLQNNWTKLGSFLSRPGIALVGILLLLAVNVAIISSNNTIPDRALAEQSGSELKDEFAINVVSIYDTENQEP